ncbi:unnamed protein product [Closterium sp. Yama58-4]|nr:unnamed protein product [Closterium sp. Yama58-4]
MQFQEDSPSPSNNSLLPSDYLNAPIFASRYQDDSADDDDNDDNDDNDVNHDVNGREIARERRSSADLARAINGVRQHWSPTETMQLVTAFVELDRENDGMRIVHGSNYYRELIALLLRKFPEFRHSQPAVKAKLIRMKNKYYRLQNRLDRSAVCSKDQLPEWYVLMDSVMERDEFRLRSARAEIRPNRGRRGRPPKSGGRPAAAQAVPKREREQGDSSDDDLNPLDGSLDDTEAYSFPALPTLPTAANTRALQYASPALPTLRTVSVTEPLPYVSPPPRFAREGSALYTPTAAAALPLKAGAASAPGAAPGASATVGQAVAAATAAGALALAVLNASNPLRGVAPIGASRLTPPPAAEDDRLTSPASARGDKLTSPASAEDDRLASPPSARDDMRMSPPITRGGRRMSAGMGPTGWRRGRWGSGWREREGFAVDPGMRSHLSARRTAGRAGLMDPEGLGAVMDEAVESAFAGFEGLTQEWVERACGEFEGMVADMAERACAQFRSAAREFAGSWKAGQDYKRRRRY